MHIAVFNANTNLLGRPVFDSSVFSGGIRRVVGLITAYIGQCPERRRWVEAETVVRCCEGLLACVRDCEVHLLK